MRLQTFGSTEYCHHCWVVCFSPSHRHDLAIHRLILNEHQTMMEERQIQTTILNFNCLYNLYLNNKPIRTWSWKVKAEECHWFVPHGTASGHIVVFISKYIYWKSNGSTGANNQSKWVGILNAFFSFRFIRKAQKEKAWHWSRVIIDSTFKNATQKRANGIK